MTIGYSKINQKVSEYFIQNSNSLFDNKSLKDGQIDYNNDGSIDASIFYKKDKQNNIIGARIYSSNNEYISDFNFKFENGNLSKMTTYGENGKQTHINATYNENGEALSSTSREYNRFGQFTEQRDTFYSENNPKFLDVDKWSYIVDSNPKNGKIDKVAQNKIGDCWLLSSLISLNVQNPQIINDMISYTEDGANIKFAFGSYNVTDKELESKKQERGFATGGDDDVIRIEIAMEKMLTDYQNNKLNLPFWDRFKNPIGTYKKNGTLDKESNQLYIDGGDSAQAYYFMTGKCVKKIRRNLNVSKFSEQMKNNEIAANVSFKNDNICMDKNGNKVEIYSKHEYSIKSFDENNVTIINPWDSSKDITISTDFFLENYKGINYCDLR